MRFVCGSSTVFSREEPTCGSVCVRAAIALRSRARRRMAKLSQSHPNGMAKLTQYQPESLQHT
eukprot:15476370-Alexandrium_andersonii.AAC.1